MKILNSDRGSNFSRATQKLKAGARNECFLNYQLEISFLVMTQSEVCSRPWSMFATDLRRDTHRNRVKAFRKSYSTCILLISKQRSGVLSLNLGSCQFPSQACATSYIIIHTQWHHNESEIWKRKTNKPGPSLWLLVWGALIFTTKSLS